MIRRRAWYISRLMTGTDYVGDRGLASAVQRWMTGVETYVHERRPEGDPDRCALIVLDLQHFFCDAASHAHLPVAVHIVPGVRHLAEVFEAAGSPVVYTRHALAEGEDPGRMGDWWGEVVRDGSPGSRLAANLAAPHVATVMRKTRYDAFEGTDLDRQLRDAGVTTLILTGVMTHLCCETTARAAFARGYHVVVAADGTASADEDLHLGALRSLAHGFAQVRTVAQILSWYVQDAAPSTASMRTPTETEHDLDGYDVVVIGGGPAGLAAAVQAIRQGLSVALFESARPGGLLHQADLVENYLGVGPQVGTVLAARITAQALESGVRPRADRVEEIEVDDGFCLTLASGGTVDARALVLATGSRPLTAKIPGETRVAGRQLFYSVTDVLRSSSPSPTAAVVGGGDAAFDQAIRLRRHGWTVSILMRSARSRALDLLHDRAAALRVQVRARTRVTSLERDGDGVLVAWRDDENSGTLPAHRILVAVGRSPDLPRVVDHRRNGVVLDEPGLLESVEGLFLAGDVHRGRFRQAAMATGDGIEAAMAVARYLEGNR